MSEAHGLRVPTGGLRANASPTCLDIPKTGERFSLSLGERICSARQRHRAYVFRVFNEYLPLPARDERGEGRGGGRPSLTQRCRLLSPALSSLRGGRGRTEQGATLNTIWGRDHN